MLEEREGDHGEDRVVVEAVPRSTFEVTEAELLLELLVRELA